MDNFEQELNALKNSIESMKEPGQSLDDLIKYYNEAQEHYDKCRIFLEKAEQTISKITASDIEK